MVGLMTVIYLENHSTDLQTVISLSVLHFSHASTLLPLLESVVMVGMVAILESQSWKAIGGGFV